MLALAGPVISAELGWIMMGIVDTIMVGRLGPEAIGAVGVGSSLFLALAVFGIGLLLGLDTLISQAFGARRVDECHRWLHHGLALACLLAPIMMLLAWIGIGTLGVWGFDPAVARLLRPYLAILVWSALPLLLYAALRRYLQAMNVVRPVMFALVSANIINALINWVLVYGRLGAPALGVDGSAWATLASRVYMAVVLAIAAVFQMFDGIQGVLTGVLRGLGDTRTPMIWNLVGHWAFGLPLGYALCFWKTWGVRGLWIGLSAGLISVGAALLVVWSRRVHQPMLNS